MKNCIMVVGYDRVGKTSLIYNIEKKYQGFFNVFTKHFTKPASDDIWVEHKKFVKFTKKDIFYSHYLLDRGFPDTFVYEKIRAGNKKVSIEDFDNLIELYNDKFNVFHIFVIRRSWNFIEKFHLEEINKGIGMEDEPMKIELRYLEYLKYYEEMRALSIMYPDYMTFIDNPPKWLSLV